MPWSLTHSTMPWAVASWNGLLRWCGITIILRTGKSIFRSQQQKKIAAKEAEAYVFVSFSLLPSFGLCSATLTSGSKTPTSCAIILTDSWVMTSGVVTSCNPFISSLETWPAFIDLEFNETLRKLLGWPRSRLVPVMMAMACCCLAVQWDYLNAIMDIAFINIATLLCLAMLTQRWWWHMMTHGCLSITCFFTLAPWMKWGPMLLSVSSTDDVANDVWVLEYHGLSIFHSSRFSTIINHKYHLAKAYVSHAAFHRSKEIGQLWSSTDVIWVKRKHIQCQLIWG